ncbi:hypothetical protein KKG41_04070 [Patescibacteria group bacterium]|nr:hypothetical protein [Patescibacteria group bacterium]MBU1889956.1 hypothetical protein [Patescibacteria group bacterium]
MSKPLTKAHLDGAIATIRGDIREFISHFNQRLDIVDKRFDQMDERFDEIDIKLDAIIEMFVTRKDMRNLIRVLKKHGIKLKESEIFIVWVSQ